MEEAAAERSVVDDGALQNDAMFGTGIDAAAPDTTADGVKVFGMFARQQRLGLTIAVLLLEIGFDSGTPVVPDKPRRAEPEFVPPLLEPPAEVHVVACLPENGVKAADLLQRPFVKSHVAARNVLGFAVADHHVGRTAGGNHDRRGHQRIIGRQEVVPADADEFAVEQIADQVAQPILVRPTVGVGKRDDLAGRRRDPGVPGHREAAIFLSEGAGFGELLQDDRGVVGRAVVHDNDFVVRVVKAAKGFQAGLESAAAVVGGHDHGNFRTTRQREMRGHAELLLHGQEGVLGAAVWPGQAEGPVLDRQPAAEPIVGKTEDHGASESAPASKLDLPRKEFALAGLAFAQGVHAELAEHEGPGVGQHLQPRQISGEVFRPVQVNVEANKVDVARTEKFGGRVVGEGEEPMGVGRSRHVD